MRSLQVEEQTSDLLSLVESWYSRLAPQPMSLFMDLLEKPFQAIRCAVFRIMTVMAMQPWGQAQFRDHPTFCEFLLNRGTEHSKQEKEEKFRIIRTLVESPTILDIMGRVYCVKLKEFVKEGPFFVQAQSAVAMESETWLLRVALIVLEPKQRWICVCSHTHTHTQLHFIVMLYCCVIIVVCCLIPSSEYNQINRKASVCVCMICHEQAKIRNNFRDIRV